MDPKTVLEVLCDSACNELFATFDLTLAPVETPATSDDQIAAVLGFAGDNLRGSIGVVADVSLLRASRTRLLGADGGEEGLEDWSGELANQILGRVKNDLLRYEQTISLATPMVLRGLKLAFAGSQRPSVRLAWSTPDGALWVWLDCRYRPGLSLTLAETPSLAFDEGEMMMF